MYVCRAVQLTGVMHVLLLDIQTDGDEQLTGISSSKYTILLDCRLSNNLNFNCWSMKVN